MTKKLITAAVVAIVAAALAVALYMLNNAPVPEGEVTTLPPTIYMIGSQDSDLRISSVQIKNSYGEYTAYTVNPEAERMLAEYAVEGLEQFPISRSLLASTMTASEIMGATSIVVENAADIAPYGLDKPQGTAVMTYTDGSVNKLTIGNYAANSEYAYAMVEGSPDIYLLNSATANLFLQNVTSYYPTAITGELVEAMQIMSVTFGGTVRNEPISIKYRPVNSVEEFVYSTHIIETPLEAELNTGFGFEIVNTIFAITAAEVVGFATGDAALAEFGLLEPYSTASFEPVPLETATEAFTISATKPDTNGYSYIHSHNTGLIYSVYAAELYWIEAQVHDLMSPMVLLPVIDTVASIVVASPSGSRRIELTHLGDEGGRQVTVDGQTVDSDSFTKYYQTLLYAKYDEVAPEPLAEKTAPLLSVTYNYNNGKRSDTVSFYAGAARKAYVVLNNAEGIFYTPSTYIDRVLEDIQKLIDGKPVTAIL